MFTCHKPQRSSLINRQVIRTLSGCLVIELKMAAHRLIRVHRHSYSQYDNVCWLLNEYRCDRLDWKTTVIVLCCDPLAILRQTIDASSCPVMPQFSAVMSTGRVNRENASHNNVTLNHKEVVPPVNRSQLNLMFCRTIYQAYQNYQWFFEPDSWKQAFFALLKANGPYNSAMRYGLWLVTDAHVHVSKQSI